MMKYNMKRYMIKAVSLLFALTALIMISCREEENIPEPDREKPADECERSEKYSLIPGEAYVKLSEAGTRSMPGFTHSLRANLRPALRSRAEEVKLEPVFIIGGVYESAQRKAGLHRWMKLTFDKTADVRQVIKELKANKDVEIVHGAVPVVLNKMNYTPVNMPVTPPLRSGLTAYNNGYDKFTAADPLLKYQWHYENNGGDENSGFKQGADINLFAAWKQETGKDDVIVAVIDSGVDSEHPDLKEAMWRDTDGKCGYNFYDDKPEIAPDHHGTHVAGTIGARNNNGIGVCGIAGGDGTPGSGVRLMSCQIFPNFDVPKNQQRPTDYTRIGKAFQWAAEHGAVLANCSWGFPWKPDEIYISEMPPVVKEGIDYFINIAGTDPNNTAKKKAGSPMKGGVVIFAAGNDSAEDIDILPSSYEPCVAVGAFNSDYSRSHYTNTGSWLDIMAPGGIVPQDAFHKGILSTIASGPLGEFEGAIFPFPEQPAYAFTQGTSMATPHVTGVAALIVSRFGKKKNDFTNEELKKRLLTSLKPFDHHIYNQDRKDKVGLGYLDAAVALEDDNHKKPDKVGKIEAKPRYFDAELSWQVSKDEDATYGLAVEYEIYISETPITAIPAATPVAKIRSFTKNPEEIIEYTVSGLKENTTYYMAILARDRWSNTSELSTIEFKTLLNHAPEVLNIPEKPVILLDIDPFYKHTLTVKDKDNHSWEFIPTSLPEGVTVTRNKKNPENLDILILKKLPVGDYAFDITVKDELEKVTTKKFSFKMVPYKSPQPVVDFDDMSFFIGEQPVGIDLSDKFEFVPGSMPSFTVESNMPSVVEAVIETGNKLMLTPKAEGMATITIVASDSKKSSARVSFDVAVSDKSGSDVFALYPVPTHSYVKILTRASVKTVNVTVTSVRGETIMKETLTVGKNPSVATLSTDNLKPGVYILHIDSGRNISKRTIIKN